MSGAEDEINRAFDQARQAERTVRDGSIDDEIAQTDRIAERLEKGGASAEPASNHDG